MNIYKNGHDWNFREKEFINNVQNVTNQNKYLACFTYVKISIFLIKYTVLFGVFYSIRMV